MRDNNCVLIFGLGFSGQAVARRALDAGMRVVGTVRSVQKADALAISIPGLKVLHGDSKNFGDELRDAAKKASHILMSAPTAEQADGLHVDPLLSLASPDWFAGASWLGYLSTTVVYGDWQGAWVSEQSPARSQSLRGMRRLDAEAAWSAVDAPVHIFRLAGIYGPGRNALETVRKGKARIIDKPGQVFSRIHVEDIAQVVLASMTKPTAQPQTPDIFNVCDDAPCEPGEVIRHACALIGVAPPKPVAFDQAGLSAMGRSFYEDNKRVRNDKAKALLGGPLLFPTYREGLAHEFEHGN